MVIGTSDPEDIPPSHWQALIRSGNLLVDEFFEDVEGLSADDVDIADTWMIAHLPRSYIPRYTSLFARQFLICMATVAWKLAQATYYNLSCVGEQIALYAIIENAVSMLEMDGLSADIDDFDAFIDEAYQDTDFLMLFDASLDGIDQSVVGQMLGMRNVRFDEWFLPFDEGLWGRVHPYLTD